MAGYRNFWPILTKTTGFCQSARTVFFLGKIVTKKKQGFKIKKTHFKFYEDVKICFHGNWVFPKFISKWKVFLFQNLVKLSTSKKQQKRVVNVACKKNKFT